MAGAKHAAIPIDARAPFIAGERAEVRRKEAVVLKTEPWVPLSSARAARAEATCKKELRQILGALK